MHWGGRLGGLIFFRHSSLLFLDRRRRHGKMLPFEVCSGLDYGLGGLQSLPSSPYSIERPRSVTAAFCVDMRLGFSRRGGNPRRNRMSGRRVSKFHWDETMA